MRNRGLSKEFLRAMRNKLEHGRQRGYDAWDNHWKFCDLGDETDSWLLKRLAGEMLELAQAMKSGNKKCITEEAADVANFAMFIADYYGDL